MMRIYVPRDAAALAVGADEVSQELEQAAASRGISIEIIRTGSRGLCWLEPMVEVATPEGRVAFGPVGTDRRTVAAGRDVGQWPTSAAARPCR